VVAVDQGTTGTTVLVVDGSGAVVASSYGEVAQSFPAPGLVEHDPEQIWAGVVALVAEALDTAGLAPGDVAGIGLTNQRETAVVWDRATGTPLHRAIVWQDRRTAELCRRLAADGAGELVSSRTGLLLDSYFSATKIAWILDHVDGARARAARGGICAGTIDSWLVWKMTGGRVHATDVTNASRTLLMDLAGARWDEELCALFDVPTEVLPSIRPSAHVFGECTAELLAGRSVPVAAVVGDQQAALFGQACFAPGQTKNTYGTGSFVLQHVGAVPPVERGPLVATVACTLDGAPTEYALEGSIFATGAAVQWLRDGLGIVESAAETEALAASLDSNDDVWFVPALAGLGAPLWDSSARGLLIGTTRGTTRAHVARAALEAIAYQSRDVLEAMAGPGYDVGELRVDGGGSVNSWLMQFQADIAGVAVDVAARRESTGLGAAFAAGIATGLWNGRDEVGALRSSARRYEPRMGHATREALYARWLEARERACHWLPRS
jgi:glycerol kinase